MDSLTLIDKREQLKIKAEAILTGAEKEKRKLNDEEVKAFDSLTEQINDVKAGIILSSVMAVLVYLAGLYIENDKLSVTIQIIFGVIIYVGFSELFKPEAYSYVRDMALKLLYNKGKYSYDEHQQEDKKHN